MQTNIMDEGESKQAWRCACHAMPCYAMSCDSCVRMTKPARTLRNRHVRQQSPVFVVVRRRLLGGDNDPDELCGGGGTGPSASCGSGRSICPSEGLRRHEIEARDARMERSQTVETWPELKTTSLRVFLFGGPSWSANRQEEDADGAG